MVECSVLFPTCVEVNVYVKRGWIYFQVNIVSSFGQSLPFKRITVGSTLGGILRVASVAERVLSKRGGRAPGCWRRGLSCPWGALGDC